MKQIRVLLTLNLEITIKHWQFFIIVQTFLSFIFFQRLLNTKIIFETMTKHCIYKSAYISNVLHYPCISVPDLLCLKLKMSAVFENAISTSLMLAVENRHSDKLNVIHLISLQNTTFPLDTSMPLAFIYDSSFVAESPACGLRIVM